MSEATEVKASTHRCSRVPARSCAIRPALCGLVFSLIVIPDASVLPDLGGVRPRGLKPAAEQADRVYDDERETAGAEPVGQPDRVTAGVGGYEARRDLTRCAAGEHLPGLQERSKGGEHTIDGRCGVEDLGEHHRGCLWWGRVRRYRCGG